MVEEVLKLVDFRRFEVVKFALKVSPNLSMNEASKQWQ